MLNSTRDKVQYGPEIGSCLGLRHVLIGEVPTGAERGFAGSARPPRPRAKRAIFGRGCFLPSFLPVLTPHALFARAARLLGAAGRRGVLLLALAGGVPAAVGQSFGSRTDYPAGSHPASAALGDVNGDGLLDLVTLSQANNAASVRLNTGAGAFGPFTDYFTGNSPRSAVLGDVNGDGLLDLVTANDSGSSLSVLLGVGAGTFGPKADYPTGVAPIGAALGDVNGDGRLDVVTANFGAGTVSVRLNTGAGTFGPKADYPTGGGPNGVALGDVNGDGRLDVVTANFTNTVSVLLNAGAGAFGPPADFATGATPVGVALGDVNGDGRLDVVTANFGVNTVSVVLNAGAGAFGPKTDYPTGARSAGVALGDVNGDGRPDLVTANDSGTASVLLNAPTLSGARAGLSAAGGGLYPNPARARFTVRLPAGAGPPGTLVRAELINAVGQVVRRQEGAVPAAGDGWAVDAAGRPAGAYTLRLLVGATVLAQRVVLQ